MNIQTVKDKRRNDFLENLADIDLDNPLVASAVIHATQIAERNHDGSFLDALFNAVFNVDSGEYDELAITFMNWMGIFTPKHIEMLRTAANPPSPPSFQKSVPSPTPNAFSPRRKSPHGVELDRIEGAIWRELHALGLVGVADRRPFSDDITRLGETFLAFLSDPDFE